MKERFWILKIGKKSGRLRLVGVRDTEGQVSTFLETYSNKQGFLVLKAINFRPTWRLDGIPHPTASNSD
jgi:hypothetical protein